MERLSDTEVGASELLHSFGAWLALRPLSKPTRRSYAAAAEAFLCWLGEDDRGAPRRALADLAALAEAADRWRSHQRGSGVPALRIAGGRSALAAFADCFGLGVPGAAGLDILEAAPRGLDDDQLDRLLTAAERISPRSGALLGVLVDTGIQLREAVALDVADVRLGHREVAVDVRGGGVARRLPVGARTRACLAAWLSGDAAVAGRRLAMTAADGSFALWVGPWDRRSAAELAADVAAAARAAGLGGLAPDRLRHAAPTRWLRQGVDLAIVADRMG